MYTFVHMNTAPLKINSGDLRRNQSSILNEVYLNDITYIVLKNNIPIVQLTKFETSMKKVETKIKTKKLDLSLFGIWKNDKRSTLAIEKELKKKAIARF